MKEKASEEISDGQVLTARSKSRRICGEESSFIIPTTQEVHGLVFIK